MPNYYTMNFALKQYHGWSITELESMIPFERDIYVILLKQHLEAEARRIANTK